MNEARLRYSTIPLRILLCAAVLGLLAAVWLFSPILVFGACLATILALVILRYPIVGVGLLAFSVPWGSALTLPGVPAQLTPTELLVVLLGGVLLVHAVAERSNPLKRAPWWPYIALFLLVIALSATQAVDTAASAREILKWAELAIVYLVVATFVRAERDVLAVLAAVIAAGVSQAFLGFVQLALNLGPAAFAAERALLRAYGTFDQPNPYAGYLNMVLPLALALAIWGPSGARRWSSLATAVLAAGVLASESRGGLLAALLAVAVIVALTSRPGARLFGAGAIAVLAAALLVTYGISLGPVTRAIDAIGLTGVDFNSVTDANFSAVERAAHWLTGVRIFAAHPFLGVGIGNYGAAYPAFHPRGWYASLDHAHNYYINIAAEAGVFGLVSYLLLAGSALWYSYSAMRLSYAAVYRSAGLGITGALIATNFHNIFDVLYVHGTTALLGLLMGLTAASFGTRPPDGAHHATNVVPAYTGLRE